MMIVALIAVVGTLCWLVFTFAVYAVPAFVGLSAAMFALPDRGGQRPVPWWSACWLVALPRSLVGQRLIASRPFARCSGSLNHRRALRCAGRPIAGYHAVRMRLASMSASPSLVWHEMLLDHWSPVR